MSTKRLRRGLANNAAFKKGMASTDANSVETGSRTFVPKWPPRTHAMNQSFNDAFNKVDDVTHHRRRLVEEVGQDFHPRACSTTITGWSLGPGH